ncbi:phage portal protein family protein [Niabella insulamsoli]|uniref:phage portal protein family protein n=1 Tax=Niabella insulamsoli TaxID=3144874 RepID=UPI0031FD8FFD
MAFSLFGYSIGKNKTGQILSPKGERSKKRASEVIKKQYRREVSFQIADIRLARQLAQNPDQPSRRKLIEIFKYILEDLRLKGQIRDAVMKVTGEPWMIYDKNENPVDDLSDKMRKRWLAQTIKHIALCEFWGFQVLEYDFIDPKECNMGVVKLIPCEHISIERAWVLIDGEVNGSYIDYNGISNDLDLVEFYDTREDLGLLANIAYNTIWKYYSRSDWSRASEKFGMPLTSIEADTNNDDELDRLERQAANLGTDGYVVTQKGDTVNIVERKGQRMHDIYWDNVKLCNEENEIGINGQVGTSSEKSFVGAAEVQERKFEDITLARLNFVANEINDKLFPYLRAKGFPIPEGYKFDYPVLIAERKNKLAKSKAMENFDPAKPAADSGPEATESGKDDQDNKQADADKKKTKG